MKVILKRMKITILKHSERKGTLAVNEKGIILLPTWKNTDACRKMMKMTDKQLTGSTWEAEIEFDEQLGEDTFTIIKFIE